MDNKILHLTLRRKWYDMILSGVKKEEYREIKPYWCKRLIYDNMWQTIEGNPVIYKSALLHTFKHFDIIRFTNGYSKNAPTFDIECKGISIGVGNPEWGAPTEQVFILSLGKIISNG